MSTTTTLLPTTYALTLGTSTTQVLPANPSRKGLIFFNPSGNTVAVCPLMNSLGQQQAAIVGGAGSISVLPGGTLVIPGSGWPDNVGLGQAFQGVASGASTPFTIWEF